METIPGRMAGSVTLETAINSLLIAKTLANLRPQYLKSLRAYLGQFCRGREETLVASVDVVILESWFASRSEGLATMASNIGRLSALFSFCERRGWIERNPCRMLERPRVDRKVPKILQPDQAEKLIAAVKERRPHMVPFFTLGMYAGIRPDELARIDWTAVDLGRSLVTVDAAASKVRRRRLVYLEPKATDLLKHGGRLPVSRATRRRYQSFACAVLGFEDWTQDLLRHTAASYLLALHQDAGKVAMRLGNSPGILMRHYQELVGPEDCLAFWSSPERFD
jgi:integrase